LFDIPRIFRTKYGIFSRQTADIHPTDEPCGALFSPASANFAVSNRLAAQTLYGQTGRHIEMDY